jgi:hypothetical protein
MTVDRVVTLLTGRHAYGLVERHIKALRRLAREKEQGFLIRELEELTRLLAACNKHVRQNDMYIEPLCDVVKLCGYVTGWKPLRIFFRKLKLGSRKPFLKVKASDESEHGNTIVTVMTELGMIDLGQTDRQAGKTDRQTDGRTDGQTDLIAYIISQVV